MQGVWMDPDMNKYDLEHVVTTHPLMSKEQWQGIYDQARGRSTTLGSTLRHYSSAPSPRASSRRV